VEPWLHQVNVKTLTGQIESIQHELQCGRGFVVIRGLSVHEYAKVCAMLGEIIPQTVAGDTIYSVRDEGLSIEQDYGRPGVRISKTRAAFNFHTDSPSRLAGHTPDYIALYVVQTAKAGGESLIVNGDHVEKVIRQERPDVLDRLYRRFWVDRRAELPPGEQPVLPVPVFTRCPGCAKIEVRYLRLYITKGHELKGEPLTSRDTEALDFFDSVMNRPEMSVRMTLQQGDIQIINNTFLLHSRTAYEDFPEPQRKRHYLRIWVRDAMT
jgi:hypothetical protein